MRQLLLILVLCTLITNSLAQNVTGNKLTYDQWSSDIDTLLNGISKVHKNLYHSVSKADLEDQISELTKKLPSLSDNQIITELAKTIAMIGDGHTVLDIFGFHNNTETVKKTIELHSYPLEGYIFDEGFYITYAFGKDKELAGRKLTKINNIKIDKVIEMILPLVSGDNSYNKKFSLPYLIFIAEYLNGAGIISKDLNAVLTFEDENGIQFEKTIDPVNLETYLKFQRNKVASSKAPLYLQNDDKNYWFKYLNDKKILYINYKRVLIDPSDSIRNFCNRLDEVIKNNDIDKTIIDIRNNGGGNNAACQTFVDFISENKKINQKGKLFTIIGRQTFSAASYLTTKLELNTNTIFTGEPTGAKPNHFGDNRPLILPNSGLTVRLSSIYWQNSFPEDNRAWTEPEIKVDVSAKDFFDNRDNVMETISDYVFNDNNSGIFSENERKQITGRYLLEPLRYTEIKEDGNKLILELRKRDFIGRDVTFISTQLYKINPINYSTGTRGLMVYLVNNVLKLSFNGIERQGSKVESNYKMPEELLDEGKFSQAITMIKDVKSKFPEYDGVTETEINGLGYKFINKKKLDAAIEIFKLNTELYPEQFNTFDSLGEAYLMVGNSELAIANYKRSVELNPRNENGKRILEKLKQQINE